MDIPAMSMSLSSIQLRLAVSTSVTKMAMQSAGISAEGLNQMLETAAPPIPSESIIDVRA